MNNPMRLILIALTMLVSACARGDNIVEAYQPPASACDVNERMQANADKIANVVNARRAANTGVAAATIASLAGLVHPLIPIVPAVLSLSPINVQPNYAQMERDYMALLVMGPCREGITQTALQ